MFSVALQSPREPEGIVSLTGFVCDDGFGTCPLGKSVGHDGQLGLSS